MWLGKIISAALSLVLVGACSLQTAEIETPALAANEEITQNYAVFFPFDSAKFADGSMATALASALQAPSIKIQLSAHTDRAGPAAYNMKLAKRRAAAVADAFVDAGISPGAINISVRGEAEPQTPTSDGKAEPTNRRVEIALITPAPPRKAVASATPAQRPGNCVVMPVYVAGTRVYSCIETFEQISTQ